MIKVYIEPQPEYFPPKGGVRTHLVKLYKHISGLVELVSNPNDADILHAESSWRIPKTIKYKPSLFTTHGGYLPSPIPNVLENLGRADKVVSVSKWIVDRFFKDQWHKTIVIPNGVDLEDFQSEKAVVCNDLILKDYILYAKEWEWYIDYFVKLAKERKDLTFVTTVWPKSQPVPKNVIYIGLQPAEKIAIFLKNAGCLLLTGSEVCPTMLLEAWACKVPVIALNIDGSKELMSNLGGYLYNDYQDLKSGIDYVLNNKATLGEQGYNEVVKNYQWSVLAKKYEKVYKELL